MAIFEWLFVDTFRIFVSTFAADRFSIFFLHILAAAFYFRLWLLWTGRIEIAVAALAITYAVPFSVIGNAIASLAAAHLCRERAHDRNRAYRHGCARTSWLPLFIFGLSQLVHGHASFIGLAPVMAMTAIFVAWMARRLPFGRPGGVTVAGFVKAHPRPFQLSIAILVLFANPILINTIVCLAGQNPEIFSVRRQTVRSYRRCDIVRHFFRANVGRLGARVFCCRQRTRPILHRRPIIVLLAYWPWRAVAPPPYSMLSMG